MRFNLIDQPWIPVRLQDGTRAELGIAQTLQRAHQIIGIEDPSPLVVAALHRLLLAVLYRAFDGPGDHNQARSLFREGWPLDRLSNYLERFHDRFWLFHPTHPFGQVPTFEPASWKPWTVLAAERNADNAKVLFDHLDVNHPGTLPDPIAARMLLATLTFSVSCGKSELAHTGTAPSATAAMAIPLGNDLADTLTFCLVPQAGPISARDRPLWERDPETIPVLKEGAPRVPDGLADRYTWRTRSIRFAEEPEPGRIARLAFASGVSCAPNNQVDPMLGYRLDDKFGKLPVILKDRGIWREFDSLLPDGGKLGPAAIEHAIDLTRKDQARFPRAVLVLGQSNNKAKIEYWRMERFTLPRALSGSQDVRGFIHGLLEQCDGADRALWSACGHYARNLLARAGRSPDAKDVRAFIDQMAPLPLFWAAMEAQFHRVLASLTSDMEFEAVERSWLQALAGALKSAWAQHRAGASGGDVWSIRALAKAEAPVARQLRELETKILEFNSVEVP